MAGPPGNPGSISAGSTSARWLLTFAVALSILGPTRVEAQPPPPTPALRCRAGSGAWEASADATQLFAALCSDGSACPGLASFQWDATGAGVARFAALPPGVSGCDLAPVGAAGRFALYHDGKHLLAADGVSLKVVWVIEAPSLRVGEAPSPLVLLHSDKRMLLLEPGQEHPQVVLDIAVDNLLEVQWQSSRLVVIEAGALRWWPLGPDGKPGQEQSTKFRDPLSKKQPFGLDDNGLMRPLDQDSRVAYYRFEPDQATATRLNSSDVIIDIGGGPVEVAAITNDTTVSRIVAPLAGTLRKDRFELKYWKLERADRGTPKWRRPLLMRGGPWIAVDGGIDGKRIALINAERMTWEISRRLDFDTPGRMVAMTATTLVTAHQQGAEPLRVWDLATGRMTASVKRPQLDKLGFGRLEKVDATTDQRFVLRDEAGRTVLYDAARDELRGATPGAERVGNRVARTASGALVLGELVSDNDKQVKRWFAAAWDKTTVRLEIPTEVQDGLSPVERWFGYCVPTLPCALRSPAFTRSPGSDAPWLSVPAVEQGARTRGPAWVVVGAAMLLLLLVMAWRCDWGRRGKVSEQFDEAAPSDLPAGSALVDERGRRFLTRRDSTGFLHGALTLLPWRLAVALAAGGATAALVGFEWLIQEPVGVAVPFWLALSVPASVSAWILVSWGVWTRKHLLRYGHAIEGQWFDSGTSRQSVCYTTKDGKTYRMRRGQWTRADLVPIVLYDPARPSLAAQYTGNGQFAVHPRRQAGSLTGGAVIRDAMRLAAALLAPAALVYGGLQSFQSAFPEPISTWTMSQLEAAASAVDQPFYPACIDTCHARGEGEACETRCHERQMGLVFRAAGTAYQGDPQLTPTQLRRQQADQLQEVLRLTAATDLTCSELAARINAVPRWTARLQAAFEKVYADPAAIGAEFEADTATLAQAAASTFAPLCLPDSGCLSGEAPCAAPPTCKGAVEPLQNALCAFAAATTPVVAPPAARAATADAGAPPTAPESP